MQKWPEEIWRVFWFALGVFISWVTGKAEQQRGLQRQLEAQSSVLSLYNIDSSSLQLTWPWMNQAHWERPRQSVSTILLAAQMWEYIPQQAQAF